MPTGNRRDVLIETLWNVKKAIPAAESVRENGF